MDDGVVAALDPVPAVVAVHREVAAADASRCAHPGWAAASRASRSRTKPRADRGGVSRPSRSAWTRTRRAPSRRASSASATRCRSLAWTPPGPIEADDVSEPPVSRAAVARREERRAFEERCRRRWRHRSAADPGGPAGRRPGSDGRPRSCPSGPAAGRPRPRRRASVACGQRAEEPTPGRHRSGRDGVACRDRRRCRTHRGRRGRSGGARLTRCGESGAGGQARPRRRCRPSRPASATRRRRGRRRCRAPRGSRRCWRP